MPVLSIMLQPIMDTSAILLHTFMSSSFTSLSVKFLVNMIQMILKNRCIGVISMVSLSTNDQRFSFFKYLLFARELAFCLTSQEELNHLFLKKT